MCCLNKLVGWLLVVGCWLLVVGCWLLVVGCWLLVVGLANALCVCKSTTTCACKTVFTNSYTCSSRIVVGWVSVGLGWVGLGWFGLGWIGCGLVGWWIRGGVGSGWCWFGVVLVWCGVGSGWCWFGVALVLSSGWCWGWFVCVRWGWFVFECARVGMCVSVLGLLWVGWFG